MLHAVLGNLARDIRFPMKRESLLMDLYHVTVPSTSTVELTEGQTDKVSEEIL